MTTREEDDEDELDGVDEEDEGDGGAGADADREGDDGGGVDDDRDEDEDQDDEDDEDDDRDEDEDDEDEDQDDADDDGAPEGTEGVGDGAPPLPGEGTADGDRLREAHRLFEVGDYAAVRTRARGLEETAKDPAVKAAARALRRRVEVDPVQVVVLLACAGLVAAIVYVWIL